MNEAKEIPATKRHSLPVSLPIKYFHRSHSSASIDYSKSNSSKMSQIPETCATKENPKLNLQQKRLKNLRTSRKPHKNGKQITRETNNMEFYVQGIFEKMDIILDRKRKENSRTATVEIQTDDVVIIMPDEMADFKKYKEINSTKPFVNQQQTVLEEFTSFGQQFKDFFSELYTMCQYFFKQYKLNETTYMCSKAKRLSFLKIVKELINMITIADDVKKELLNKNSSKADQVLQEDIINNNNEQFENSNEKVKDSAYQSETIEKPQDQNPVQEQEQQTILELALADKHFDHNTIETTELQPHKKLQNGNQIMASQQNYMKFPQQNFVNNTCNNQQNQRIPRTSSTVTSFQSVQSQRKQFLNTQTTQAIQQLQQNQQSQMHPNTGYYSDYQNKMFRYPGKLNMRDTPYQQKTQMNSKKVWQQQPFQQMVQVPPPQLPYNQQNPQQLFHQQMYYQQNFNAP